MEFVNLGSMSVAVDPHFYLRWHVSPNLAFLTLWKQVQGEWVDGSFVYGSDSGYGVEVYDKAFGLVRRLAPEGKNLSGGGIATSPSGQHTAIVRHGEIVVEGENRIRFEAQHLDNPGEKWAEFSADSRYLWVTQPNCRVGDHPVRSGRVGVIEIASGKIAWDSPSFLAAFPDQQYGLHLSSHPSGAMLLWIVAFNRIHRYWVRFGGHHFDYSLESKSADCGGLHFNEDGSKFLTSNSDTMWLKRFPDGSTLAELGFSSPEDWHAAGALEESFTDSCGFISERHALINTNDPKLLVIDLETMSVAKVENAPQASDPFYAHSSGALITIWYGSGQTRFDRWQVKV
jgi:hypothetical protein